MRPPDDLLPRIAKLSCGVAKRAGSLAKSAARHVAARVPGHDAGAADDEQRFEAPSPEPAPRPAPSAVAAQAPAGHVDREAVVVAEFADPGAEDGPGAQIRIDEPWDGYATQTAKQITAELATATPAALAVVRLYEAAHRNRSTVLAAIDRRLAAAGD